VEKGVLDDADAERVKDLLAHKSTPNGGNAVTNDLKWCSKSPLIGPYYEHQKMDTNDFISQVFEAEPYPFLADCSVGRFRRAQRLQLVGREGMVSIL
jgi:hypothetical protein